MTPLLAHHPSRRIPRGQFSTQLHRENCKIFATRKKNKNYFEGLEKKNATKTYDSPILSLSIPPRHTNKQSKLLEHLMMIKIFSDNIETVARPLPDRCQTVARPLPDCCQKKNVSKFLGYFMFLELFCEPLNTLRPGGSNPVCLPA
ncbi:hypothetical protein HELRODRAFT_177205 [Helobdella robusta]|uniref:Uncharacterized protein n=1 Tax=Helobdella robusta TaxID=6412 RepID=T1FBC6_HELRO|nr:hypothetical protein HELRODRAFT_177205 [Helobdella robusta]ESN98320.1 hypothetical protein HELRODRAFT_177205 [Helobdella robusta]